MHQAFIFAWRASNVTFEGGGVVDCGSREDTWWRCAKDLSRPPCGGYGRPHCIMFSDARHVVVRNVTVRNSSDWTLHFSNVTGLRVSHMQVLNPDAPNSDGIDIDSSQDVVVEDSHFSVGDDALCVKSGIDYFGRLYGMPSKDILFRRISIGRGHGISVGSETSGGASNITFEDIDMDGTNIGLRIKSQRGRGGVVSGIVYRNVRMRNIRDQCISFTMNFHHGLRPTNETATPKLRDVFLHNVHCESASNSYLLDGLPEQSIVGLRLSNVTMGRAVGKLSACDYVECTCDEATIPCPDCCKKD